MLPISKKKTNLHPIEWKTIHDKIMITLTEQMLLLLSLKDVAANSTDLSEYGKLM